MTELQTGGAVTNYHLLGVDEAIQSAASSTQGLSSHEVEKRRANGRNELEGDAGLSPLKILMGHVFNSITFILAVAVALSFVAHDYPSAGVIIAVIILNIAVGYVQEFRSEKTMEALKSMSSPTARVLRAGVAESIPAADLVVGDIIILEEGDQVPADARVIEALNLETDEALLTGESLPMAKHTHALSAADCPVGDRHNMVFKSSTIAQGRGKALVVKIGMETEIGRIAGSIMSTKKKATPLQRRMTLLAYALFLFAGLLAIVIFGSNKFKADSETMLYAVSVAVAIIPESLVAVITVTLAYGVRRMSQQKVIVRKIAALENLGAVTNICSDKTGTLTEGRMAATKVFSTGLNTAYDVTGVGQSVEGTMVSVALRLPSQIPSVSSHNNVMLSAYAGSQVSLSAHGTATTPHAGPSIGSGNSAPALPSAMAEPQVQVQVPAQALPSAGSGLALNLLGGQRLHQTVDPAAIPDPLHQVLVSGVLCNNANVTVDDEGMVTPAGDQTEIALVLLGRKMGLSKQGLLAQGPDGHEFVFELPFDATLKRMSSIYLGPAGTGGDGTASRPLKLYAKGALEAILQVSTSILVPSSQGASHVAPLDPSHQAHVTRVMAAMADQGLRVIGVATRDLDPSQWDPAVLPTLALKEARPQLEAGLTLIGLVGILDPPRKETLGAVEVCHAAGINVTMATGDHPGTAAAIARMVAILPPQHSTSFGMVMHASDFDRLSDAEVDAMPNLPRVLARCSPETKVKLVAALHRRQRRVAMTGDGTNDAPALKKADVGIAMGLNGSDVAKSVSDMLLTDDNFHSIVIAIEEGRRIFSNLRKFVIHLMSSNVAECLVLMAGLAWRSASDTSLFPLSPVHILWLNMVTSTPPALGLGMEAASKDVMEVPPRTAKEGLFSWEVISDLVYYGAAMGLITLANYAVVLEFSPFRNGNPIPKKCNETYDGEACDDLYHARGTAFITLSLMLLIHAYNCRDLRRSCFMGGKGWVTNNKWIFYSVVLGALLVVPTLYIPGLNTVVLKQKPLSWEWACVVCGILLFQVLVELYKWCKRRYLPRAQPVAAIRQTLRKRGESLHPVINSPMDVRPDSTSDLPYLAEMAVHGAGQCHAGKTMEAVEEEAGPGKV